MEEVEDKSTNTETIDTNTKGNEKVKELLNKMKMNFLVTRKYLLTFIFLGVSNILFIFALVALCLHQCPGSITAFVIATIIDCAAIALFVLMFRIIKLLDDDDEQPKVEDKKVEDVKEETKEDEGLSLKESIALAKANTSDHKFTKAYVSEYLKNREDVEVNARDNYTKTGLPLADTLYAEKDGKKTCFAYVYEIDGSMILLAKMDSKYANELKKKQNTLRQTGRQRNID
jgi:hypothetical protein